MDFETVAIISPLHDARLACVRDDEWDTTHFPENSEIKPFMQSKIEILMK